MIGKKHAIYRRMKRGKKRFERNSQHTISIYYMYASNGVLHDDNHKDYTYSVMLLLLPDVHRPFLAFVAIFHSIVVLSSAFESEIFIFVFFFFSHPHILNLSCACCCCCFSYAPRFFFHPRQRFVCSSIHCSFYTDGLCIRVCRR